MKAQPISLFDFQGQPVRLLMRAGAPWFVGVDVCRVLGLVNSRQAILGNEASGSLGLDEDERGVFNLDTLGGNQAVQIISESGLYSLIFKSRKPTARSFRKWVTAEVLPALRERGRFEMEAAARECARGQLARWRALLLETALDVKSGALTPGKAQAVAIAAQRYLETLKIEGDALGYDKVLGLPSDGGGDDVLPLKHDLLQGVPRQTPPGTATGESGLPFEPIPGEEGLGGAPPGEGRGLRPGEPGTEAGGDLRDGADGSAGV